MSTKSSSTPSKKKQSSIKKIFLKGAISKEDISDDVIETTPENEKKSKFKIKTINSHLLKQKNQHAATKGSVTKKSDNFITEISPIPKSATNSRKLSLKKPLKRRCSFSPKESNNPKKLKSIDVEEAEIGELKKYLLPNLTVNQNKKLQNGELFKDEKKETKQSEKQEDIIDVSDDGLFDDLDDIKFLTAAPKSDHKNVSLDINMDDSLDLLDVECGLEENKSKSTNFITWKIKEISVKEYIDAHSQMKQERILTLLKSGNDDETAVCHLRDDWFLMEVEVLDIAFVSNLDSKIKRVVLDNTSKEYITIFPNTLISGTTIATGITCERQAVLNDRFKTNHQNEVMLVGTLTHELFEWALTNKKYSMPYLLAQMKELLQQSKYLETFYQLEIDENQIASKLKEYLPQIELWSKTYLNNKSMSSGKELNIQKVVDIEENVWSPYLGFKGKVDVSVVVNLHKKPQLKCKKGSLVPLELKTGKMMSTLGSVEHRAQVAVYCLLMGERHKLPIDSGLLYYIKTNHMQQIPMPEQEKRAIFIKRNEIARRLTLEKEVPTLPDLLRNKRICKRCPQNQVCMLHFKARDKGEAQTSGVNEIFTELTSHLKEKDFQYFAKWYELLLLEAYHEASEHKERFIWKKSSTTRELRGVCFSGLVLSHEDVTSDGKYHYTFERKKNHFNQACPMTSIPLITGDRVIISRENERVFNETTGYILGVNTNEVKISAHHKVIDSKGVYYRVDKDETLNNLSTPLSNLANLFQVASRLDEKLRQSIIHQKRPEFLEENEPFKCCNKRKSLNQVQQKAIGRCLQAQDYVMILGMPGSGKSTTTACLVQTLVASGKKVLLTSYTHSAVDTILLKLVQNGFTNFTRLGQAQRVHPNIQQYTSQYQTKTFTKTEQLRQYYDHQRVFASTCLGVNSPILSKQRFDYCIVDEASQITQPVCIGAVRLADVFILVGDHNQLPPLVQSEKARANGMGESLFKSLSDSHAEGVVTLHYQYRMNKDIMSLSNQLIYDEQMKCGNESVANAMLDLPKFQEIDAEMTSIIDPHRSVVFVDTDDLDCKEEVHGKKLVNIGEAKQCQRVISSLINAGLSTSKIGVICPYRHQLKILREQISIPSSQLEIETIDKYQGKDKECIIVTFVRSNDRQEVGELLMDWRRVNVALTRAKKKLILIGSKKTIVGSAILKQMLDILDRNSWCVSLQNTVP